MGGAKAEPANAARTRIQLQVQRLGIEVRMARVAEGMSQAAVASRARVSQTTVGRLEAGDPRLSVMMVGSVFAALGMDLSLRAFPGAGVRLRDSGQIALTDAIRAQAHRSWRLSLEAPVGDRSGQAADVLLLGRSFGVHIEVESALMDLQAQLRKGQLKRDSLERRVGMNLAFVMALRESDRNRAAIRGVASVVREALPASSREVLAALRSGSALSRDGLLWIRPLGERRESQSGVTGSRDIDPRGRAGSHL
ncbi:MAG: helix-turn-helix domain-containing protein [Candidatus Limnocylindria bacterium]